MIVRRCAILAFVAALLMALGAAARARAQPQPSEAVESQRPSPTPEPTPAIAEPLAPANPALEPLADRVAALRAESQAVEARVAGAQALLSDLRTRIAAIEALDADVRARAASTTSRLQIGVVLRRAKATLPSPAELRAASRAAARDSARADDRAFEVRELRDALPSGAPGVRDLLINDFTIADPSTGDVEEASRLVSALDQAAATLLDALSAPDGLVALLAEVGAAQATLAERSQSLAEFINARVLWVKSDPSMRGSHVGALLQAVLSFVSPSRWAPFARAFLQTGWVAASGAFLGLIVALALARFFAARRLRRLLDRVAAANADSRHPDTDNAGPQESPLVVIEAAAMLAIMAGALPGAVWALSRIALALAAEGAGRLAPAVAAGLTTCALALFLGAIALGLVRRNGLGEVVLHWKPAATAAARRHIVWFAPALASTLGVFGFTSALADTAEERLLPRTVFIILMLMVGAFVAIALRPGGRIMRNALGPVARAGGARKALIGAHLLLVLGMLALAVMTAMGWFFSAQVIAARLRDTAGVVALALLLVALGLRWFGAAMRRAQRRQERELAELALQKPPPLIEQRRPTDLVDLARQVRALVGIVVALAVAAVLVPVWNDVIPALARLDSIGVLPPGPVDAVSVRAKGAYVLTVGDVLRTAVIGAIGFFAVRTLPGMIDGLALARTRLDGGARYAIVTIVRYALLGLTAFLVLGALRTKWGNVGWVLGGLSVGIGLGLQGFIANFVGGLSLLFDRTIRPGDRVQVGEHLGVVKEITIRATTLADFRRRDIIIPNQEMLTGIVINETRTDRTGVATFFVGVAYGSDTALVQRLLLQVGRAHPAALDVTANFDGFGDNALNFKVWVVIREIDDRPQVVNDLHLAIERAFRDNNIEVSFPQRDLHLRGGEVVVRLAEPLADTRPGRP